MQAASDPVRPTMTTAAFGASTTYAQLTASRVPGDPRSPSDNTRPPDENHRCVQKADHGRSAAVNAFSISNNPLAVSATTCLSPSSPINARSIADGQCTAPDTHSGFRNADNHQVAADNQRSASDDVCSSSVNQRAQDDDTPRCLERKQCAHSCPDALHSVQNADDTPSSANNARSPSVNACSPPTMHTRPDDPLQGVLYANSVLLGTDRPFLDAVLPFVN